LTHVQTVAIVELINKITKRGRIDFAYHLVDS